jgi:hypothetical protein
MPDDYGPPAPLPTLDPTPTPGFDDLEATAVALPAPNYANTSTPGAGYSAASPATPTAEVKPPAAEGITAGDVLYGLRQVSDITDPASLDATSGYNWIEGLQVAVGPYSPGLSDAIGSAAPFIAAASTGYSVAYDNLTNTGPYNIHPNITPYTVGVSTATVGYIAFIVHISGGMRGR